MNRLSRSTALKLAAVLAIVNALITLRIFGPLLAQGEAAAEALPYGIILSGVLMSVVAIVAAYGLWQKQRWGIILTILNNALAILSAAPGLLLAPTGTLQLSALTGILISIVIILLCLWRERKSVTG